MINISLRNSELSPGHWIEGSCQWFPEVSDRGKKAVLIVGWRTEGRGDVDQQDLEKIEIEPEVVVPLRCQIPLDAPCSYDGELIRILWEVRVEIKGRFMGKSSSESKPFRVILANALKP